MEQIKVNVPEGCTANIKKEDGFLILTFEQKEKEGNEKEKSEEWEPKDGDMIYFGNDAIGIFKEFNGYFHTDYATISDGVTYFYKQGWIKDNIRHATDSEKQRLFDALAKAGKRWNAEKKRVEYLQRWRQKHDECYYFIDSELNVSYQPDVRCKTDNNRHEAGNYFKTKEAAERVASQIREILNKSKAE